MSRQIRVNNFMVRNVHEITLTSYFLRVNSTLSDYMIHLLPDRHSDWDCRNPGPMDGFMLAIHGTGCPLPGGHDELADNLTKWN
jgi:hypothetical protein